MAGSPPDYDNIRQGGPDGLRIPQEQGKATYAVKKLVTVNLGTEGSGNVYTLLPSETLSSEVIVTNGSGAATVKWPGAFPGHVFVAYNNSGATCTFQVTGQTGVAVATGKRAVLVCESTDIARVTADT